MPGLIVFGAGCLTNQGKSQIATKPFPQGMTFEISNLVEVLLAAAEADGRIKKILTGQDPLVIDIGTPFSRCTMTTRGLLTMPAERPANPEYWNAFDQKDKARGAYTTGYIDVKEGMHISHSCADPHLTIILYDGSWRQVGQNIHVCAEPVDKKWRFTRVHG